MNEKKPVFGLKYCKYFLDHKLNINYNIMCNKMLSWDIWPYTGSKHSITNKQIFWYINTYWFHVYIFFFSTNIKYIIL